MEKKNGYVLNFLALSKLNWNAIIKKAISWEEKARKYYVDVIEMERDEFVQLLIFDGCFVVMYIIGCMFEEFRNRDITFLWRFNNGIFKDLLMLENQLPFFLLHALYDLVAISQPLLLRIYFIDLLRRYFSHSREGILSHVERNNFDIDPRKVSHLVDFLRLHFTQLISPTYLSLSFDDLFLSWPLTATELHDCGISFQRENRLYYGRRRISLMEMSFIERSGVLKMPEIIIDDSFEIVFRNMIAYEYCHLKSKDVSNFGMFMHFLIKTNKDVSLLVDNGVIRNYLGSTKEIVVLFDNLVKNVKIEGNLYSFECRKMRILQATSTSVDDFVET